MPSPSSWLPLKPDVFEILAALSSRELHGYAILKEIEERGVGMAASLLYRKLRRLMEDGLVVECEERPDPEDDDTRRRYYRLTDLGRRVLEAEARRIVELADTVRIRRMAGKGPSSKTAGPRAKEAARGV
jgi:DNA-binding PadR family transcriptional regulator